MKKSFFLLSIFFAFVVMSSCKDKTDEDYLTQRVDSFAVHYYNWQLEKCVSQVTAESVDKLEYVASNITQEDVNLLRSAEKTSTYDINEIYIDGKEATVELTVYDCFCAEEIGKPLQMKEESKVQMHLVKENNVWKVKL